MAEALKTFFSPSLVSRLAASIRAVHPAFPVARFVRDATRGLEELELLARAAHLASALHAHLPADYPTALDVLLRSLGPEHPGDELVGVGMAPFFYLPHTMFVATYGLEHFTLSMDAQHALTRRFTCEFSVRAFLERHPDATLEVMARWARDPSPHVRRLVSEGTRPRLPWAPRVRWIEQHPERVLPLLEVLRDDPASVVRRSVANHLNDLAKANPELACDVAERWLEDATTERRALVEHALRFLVKKGDRRALRLLGFGGSPQVEVVRATFSPRRVAIGESTRVSFVLRSTSRRAQSLSVDMVVHFVKATGRTGAKVFKVGRITLGPGEEATLAKSVSLAVHTTRRPNPGRHLVEARVNGLDVPLGAFVVVGDAP